jgi:hypothetical protein
MQGSPNCSPCSPTESQWSLKPPRSSQTPSPSAAKTTKSKEAREVSIADLHHLISFFQIEASKLNIKGKRGPLAEMRSYGTWNCGDIRVIRILICE